MVARAIFALLW